MPAPLLDRRSLLVAAARLGVGLAGAAALTSCGTLPGSSRTAGGTASPTATSSAGGSTTGTDADVERVAEATTLLSGLASAGRATLGTLPAADRAAARRLVRLHDAQVARLSSEETPATTPATTPDAPAGRRSLGRLRRQEASAQRDLLALATAADSGALARLLAGLAAGLSQAAVLDPLGGPASVPSSAAVPDLTGTAADGLLAQDGVDALQAALAAEHAAIWVLASLGAATSVSTQPTQYLALQAASAAHRDRRDDLEDALRSLDVDPVGSAAAYDLPSLRTPARVRAAARDLESATAEAYGYMTAATTGSLRRWAAGVVADASVTSLVIGPAAGARPTGLLA
ncbi:DUF4439 domain-containing protein [Nocardioides bruguierae]|uniref:DUF4439 domain-containing protein n=1 Tax=Nocardioides bruguierae TaxID=2945102 RepID=UPI00202110D1|nr:DUF4439 domain-containing protein [Nocardioides bruguierae]MCL8027106.1 ferritin-like domain-containing protein [Nocardioides bruguierae]